MTVHPLAKLFPLMEGQAFDDLCEDIRKRGQLIPITVQGDLVLDGRNRQRACERLCKPVKQVQFESLGLKVSAEEYIWSMNVQRRHLTADQMAAIAMQWRPQMLEDGRKAMGEGGKRGSPKGLVKPPNLFKRVHGPGTRERLAKLAGVTAHRIRRAEEIHDQPELLEAVKAGTLSLVEAVRKSKDQPKPNKRKVILENASKRQMVELLSQIRGMCRGLTEINLSILREGCGKQDLKTWAKTARELAKTLRHFASELYKEEDTNEKDDQA